MLSYFYTIKNPQKEVYSSTFIEVLIVLSIFSKEIGSRRIFGIDFDFIAYPFAVVTFLYYLRQILLSEVLPWRLYLYLIISTLFSILLLKTTYAGFLKQIVPIIIIYSVNFFLVNHYDWRTLFRIYVKFAFISAVFGIVQVIASYGGLMILTNQAGRLDSIAYEPSHYASILVPALVFVFFHFNHYRLYFFTMLIALILTYNLTGYMAFLVVVSIAYVSPIYFIVSLPLLYYLAFHVFINFNENFSMRIQDTQAVFRGDINVLNRTADANGTTVSLYSNLMVAWNNFIKGNYLGCGLGGHEESYYRYYEHSSFRFNYFYGLNAPSGHSLTIRIFSEFGIIGLVLYIINFIRTVVLLDEGIFRSISLACLSHFVCKSFKLGGYIDYGTPFFFAILSINYIRYRQYIKKIKSQNVGKEKPVLVSVFETT
jgi:hypothetical protein